VIQSMSAEIDQLAKALCAAQSVMKGAVKDATNPAFRTTYADLASVWDAARSPLTSNGLSVSQHPGRTEDGQVSVTTILMHSSGQHIISVVSAMPTQGTPQAAGSVVTYLRRYALSSVVGIAPEDDDGHAASEPSPHHGRPTPQRQADPGPSPQLVKTAERAVKEFGGTVEYERTEPAGAAGAPACPKCGSGEMWDNRARKASGQGNPKAPDFSCKDKTCGGAIWPARTGGASRKPAPLATVERDQAPPPSDDDMPF